MLRIGDFSKLAQVPVATLRYYDQLGLLTPAEVDKFTEYRYYLVEQLPRLNRILALKDLGFSLEQIDRMLQEDLSVKELRAMYTLRQADAERDVLEKQEQLYRVASRLREIEEEGQPSKYDLVTKSVPGQWIVSTRQIVPNAEDMSELCWSLHGQLRAWAEQHGLKPLALPAPQLVNLYYNTEYTETNLDLEAAILIAEPSPAVRNKPDAALLFTVRELEGEPLVASGILRGSMDEFGQLAKALITWVGVNNYETVGPLREVHLTPRVANPRIVEIQLPIKRA